MLTVNASLDALEKFDPKDHSPWMTYLPSRGASQGVKFHRNRPAALNSFSGSRYALLYRNATQGWQLECRKAPEDFNFLCSLCHRSTVVPSGVRDGRFRYQVTLPNGSHVLDEGHFEYVRDHSGKIVDPVAVMYLCPNCPVWP